MCDSVVVSKDFCLNGCTIFGKNSDRVVNEPQPFVFVPAADHEPGSKVKCTYIEVEQAAHTNAVILSKPSWIWGAEIGVNEHGVCVGNEAVFSNVMNQTEPALLGMDILRMALERANTARQAVDVIAELMEKYGQGGNTRFDGERYYDNGYLITDGTETWHVETAGKHYWAAKQIQGPYSISNYMALNYPDIMHKELQERASEDAQEGPFDFAKTFVDWSSPSNASGMQRRCCSYQKAVRAPKHFRIEDMMDLLRSHYTADTWTKGGCCVCMHAQNPVNENQVASQTTNSMIALCKGKDTVMWGTGMSTTCIAPFQPFWFDAYSKKQVFSYDNLEAAMDEWLKREGINREILAGRIPEAEYKKELYRMEEKWFGQVETVSADRESRQALCDAIADEAEAFIDKWLEYAKNAEEKPLGTKEFQEYWKEQTKLLGKDRRIAY